MKQRLIQLATAAVVAGGLAFAQSPAPSPSQPGSRQAAVNRRAGHRHRMMQELNLTDAQKQQAKAIFQQAREKAKPVWQELRQDREALHAAVKADDAARIHSLAVKEGRLKGELVANRSEAMAKFYATLNPEQRAKADQMRQRMRERSEQRRSS